MATFYKNRVVDANSNKDSERLKVERTGVTNIMPSGWSYNISAVTVEPGYELCIYNRPFLQTSSTGVTPLCLGEGEYPDMKYLKRGPNTHWSDQIASFTLKKDCDHPRWVWDSDCIYGSEIHTIGNCKDKKSKCHQNRIIHCNTEDDPDKECLNFCNQNHGACDLVMNKYCNIEKNKDSAICSCINSPAVNFGPTCVDRRCASLGYATSSMLETECPDEIDCNVYYNIGGSESTVDFTDGTVKTRCDKSSSSSSSSPSQSSSQSPINKPLSPLPPLPELASDGDSSILGQVIKLVIILALVSVIIYILYVVMSRKAQPVATGQLDKMIF